jgi:hypothetical protein
VQAVYFFKINYVFHVDIQIQFSTVISMPEEEANKWYAMLMVKFQAIFATGRK